MIGWLWANEGEMAVGKINIALAEVDVNLCRGEVLLLYPAPGTPHTDLFRYSAEMIQMQKRHLEIIKGLIRLSFQH